MDASGLWCIDPCSLHVFGCLRVYLITRICSSISTTCTHQLMLFDMNLLASNLNLVILPKLKLFIIIHLSESICPQFDCLLAQMKSGARPGKSSPGTARCQGRPGPRLLANAPLPRISIIFPFAICIITFLHFPSSCSCRCRWPPSVPGSTSDGNAPGTASAAALTAGTAGTAGSPGCGAGPGGGAAAPNAWQRRAAAGSSTASWRTLRYKCDKVEYKVTQMWYKSDTQVIHMYSNCDNEKEWTCLCQSLDMSDMWSSVICLPASLQRGKCHLPVLSRKTVQVLRFSVESGFNHEVNKQYDREQKPWTGFPWTGCEHWTLSLFWRSNVLKNDELVGSWVLTSCQSCQGPVPMVPWYSGIGGDAPVLAKAGVWSSLWSFSADLNLPVFGSNSDARMPAPDAFSFENRRPIAFTKLPSHQRSLSLTWAGPYEWHQAEVEKVRKLRDEFEGASAECLDKLERGRARARPGHEVWLLSMGSFSL